VYQSTGSGSPDKEPMYYSSGDPPTRLSLEETLAGIADGTEMAKSRVSRKDRRVVDTIGREFHDGIKSGGRGGVHPDAWDASNFADGLVRAVRIAARERALKCETRPRTTSRPRERRPGSQRVTRSAETPPDEPEPPRAACRHSREEIEQGLLLLLYWSSARVQERAFEDALEDLEELLNGDRLFDEDVETYIVLYRDDSWPIEDREEFPFWVSSEHPELFSRPVNGRSTLCEPEFYGENDGDYPALDDSERPF
jgi:hypothetical protein